MFRVKVEVYCIEQLKDETEEEKNIINDSYKGSICGSYNFVSCWLHLTYTKKCIGLSNYRIKNGGGAETNSFDLGPDNYLFAHLCNKSVIYFNPNVP